MSKWVLWSSHEASDQIAPETYRWTYIVTIWRATQRRERVRSCLRYYGICVSLAIPVPSFPSSNGPTTTTLTTRGLCAAPSSGWVQSLFPFFFVRPHRWRSWVMVRFFEIQGPNCRETLHRPLPTTRATLWSKEPPPPSYLLCSLIKNRV